MSKLVVFDVDGTILDSLGHFDKVLVKYSQERGLPTPCLKTIRAGYGDPHNHDFKWGLGREEQVQHLYAAYRISDVIARQEPPVLYDGVQEALVHFKDLGHTLALVTSKPEAPLLHVLEEHKLGHFFCGIRHGNDEERRNEREKPFPDQLQSLMRELKFHPDETVMVGDTTMDIRMGRGADTQTLGVLWGAHGHDDLKTAGAHHIVDDHFDHVVRTVKKIFGE